MEKNLRINKIKDSFLDYYNKNEVRLSIGFFIAGFLFDIITLSEIDDIFSICQQIIYLGIIGVILYFDFIKSYVEIEVSPYFKKIWDYRQLIVHFILGSLLSLYSIFYFKSSSLINSFIFIIIMSLILIANELTRVQQSGIWIKVALYTLCLIAFFSFIYPTALGFMGIIPFTLSIITTSLVFFFAYKKLSKYPLDSSLIKKHLGLPIALVQLFFVLFYFIGWIPPVPLSIKYIGIYHNIEKSEGKYNLYHENPWWKFWNNGDQNFYARTGDKLYVFANIYSPARFNDKVIVRWVYKDEISGWITWDKIPITISGGRQDGFRGYTFKSNYKPGEWKVLIETTNEQEIGRAYFTILEDTSTQERVFQIDVK